LAPATRAATHSGRPLRQPPRAPQRTRAAR